MTGIDYNVNTIDIFKEMPSDEWLNGSLKEVKINAMIEQYYLVLNQDDIMSINWSKNTNERLLELGKKIREKSTSSALNDNDRKEMLSAYKEYLFTFMKIMQDYIIKKYVKQETVTGRAGGKVV